MNWKPKEKKAALCFTIDDIFPGKSTDLYEAGGDLEKGVFKHLLWLTSRHPKLKITLFTTADWRETSPFPTRKLIAKIPMFRDKFYLSKVLKKGTMSLVNHPEFVSFLNQNKQFEIACHGLHHVHKGLKIPVEFQNQTKQEFQEIVKEMIHIFDKSKIDYVKGICPPGWNAPQQLIEVLQENDFSFLASSRDVKSPISKKAKANMSGLQGVSLLYPELLSNKLIHFPSNMQANNSIDRIFDIIENEGLVSIKGHMIKRILNYVAIDGIDELYVNYLDCIFTEIENRYGEAIWWTTMGEMATYIKQNNKSDE
jgi:peptidoglycan/xylan/chitin deacetylase (PgdA/CDA1 family)